MCIVGTNIQPMNNISSIYFPNPNLLPSIFSNLTSHLFTSRQNHLCSPTMIFVSFTSSGIDSQVFFISIKTTINRSLTHHQNHHL